MANDAKSGPGRIGWIDRTGRDAGGVRDFYRDVTGWIAAPAGIGYYAALYETQLQPE